MMKIKYLFVCFTLFLLSCTKWNLDKNNMLDLANVTIESLSNKSALSFTVNAEITDLGYQSSISDYGVVYSDIEHPTIENSTIKSLGSTKKVKSYGVKIEHNLIENTLYYVRAYVRNNAGINYSKTLTYTTSSLTNGSGGGSNSSGDGSGDSGGGSGSGGSSSNLLQLINPINQAELNANIPVLFQWSDVDNAISYQLQIDESAAMSSPSFEDVVNETSKTINNFIQNQTYYWRVRSFDGTTYSNWSETRVFSIKTSVILTSFISFPSNVSVEQADKIIPFQENGNWSFVALCPYWSGGSNTKKILRYNVGSNIHNSPQYINNLILDQYVTGFDFIEVDNRYYGFQIRPYFGKPFERLNFGTDPFASLESTVDLIEMSNSTVGLSLIEMAGNYYGFTVDDRDLVRISLGSNIENTDYSLFSFNTSNIKKVSVSNNNQNYFVSALTNSDQLQLWDFGSNIQSNLPSVITIDLSEFDYLQDAMFFKQNENWYAIIVGGFNDYAILIDFNGYPSNTYTTHSFNLSNASPKSVNVIQSNGETSVIIGSDLGIYTANISSYLD